MPIHGYPGNVITANPTAPTVSSASGVWTTEQQLLAVSQGNWPGYEYPLANSLRFNSADSAYLNRTPASAGNRRTWTWSGWVKRSALGATQGLFGAYSAANNTDNLWLGFSSGDLFIISRNSDELRRTTQVFRDVSAWYHIVVALDTTQATANDRVKVYLNGTQITAFTTTNNPTQNDNQGINQAAEHRIGRRPDSTDYLNSYLTEVNFIDGQALDPSSFGLNDPETGVWSPKRYTGTYGTNGFYLPMTTEGQWSGYFDGTGDYLTVADSANLAFGTNPFTVECWFYRTSASTTHGLMSLQQNAGGYAAVRVQLTSAGVFDIYVSQNGSAWSNSFTGIGSVSLNTWYHFAFVRESSGAIKIYLNGTQINTTATNTSSLLDGTTNAIGAVFSGSYLPFAGYISNFRQVVGTAVYTGNFTPPTSQLTAITNTQLLTCQSSTFVDNSTNALTITAAGDSRPQQFSPFADSIDDRSGRGNNWNPNNLDLRTTGAGADIMVDVPTAYGTDTGVGGEVRGNYCTLNPLDKTAAVTLSNGNLQALLNGINYFAKSTIAISSGKWYWEVTASATAEDMIGITKADVATTGYFGSQATSYGYYKTNGNKYNSATGTAYGASYASGDIIGVALDLDAGTLTYYKNGVSQGTAFTGLSGTFFAGVSTAGTGGTQTINFGQRPFAYTAPSGFKALCTQNFTTPTIGATSTTQANDYFNAVLYSGNSSTQAITGVGFQPDFVWCKGRSTGGHHIVADAVRTAAKVLSTSQTAAESAWSDNAFFQSLNSDGFTLTGGGTGINTTGNTYVAWNWKANGAGGSNTAGTITSTVSANTTSGFSIVTYTGQEPTPGTIGHGLGTAPFMIITKNRSSTGNWGVYHKFMDASSPQAYYAQLNSTSARINATDIWNNTAPTSTVFSVGNAGTTNASGSSFVAYCFAPVAGYSAFGSYTGNGSADGPFVYTGFRPKYVMIKNSTTGGAGYDWFVWDSVRDTYNLTTLDLNPNSSQVENTNSGDGLDILSNGFKIRVSTAATNTSGNTFIYACFAESPFKYSLAR